MTSHSPRRADTVDRTDSIEIRPFGQLADGIPVRLFTLRLPDGSSVTLSEHGCRIVSIRVPDAAGETGEITLAPETLAGCLADPYYMGVLVGRCANRISRARFTLDGTEYTLAANQDADHLHGGVHGFGSKLWKGAIVPDAKNPRVRFTYISPDGEEGYPGNLRCAATFTFREPRQLEVVLEAMTDRATVVNLTLHPYFNLAGPGRPITAHRLTLASDQFLPVGEDGIPTGELRGVEGSPFDFQSATAIGERIDNADDQLRLMGGYDHCWVLPGGREPQTVVRVEEPESGRWMELDTNAPGIQLYTGNSLGAATSAAGLPGSARRSAFCLEPESWPDAVNKPDFPPAILRPGRLYSRTIVYRFGSGFNV